MNLLLKKKTFCKENIEKVEILERETAKAILEAKEIDFSKPYYEEHNLQQTPAEIEKEKRQEVDDSLNLASACFEEHIQAAKNIDEENYRNLISSTNKKIDLIVDNKPTFEDWFIDKEPVERDADVFKEDKVFIMEL